MFGKPFVYTIILFTCMCTSGYSIPSFDCKAAKTAIEKAICSNDFVGELDSILSRIYKKSLKHASNPEALKQEQLQWLKNRKESEAALENAYHGRILELLKNPEIRQLLTKEIFKNPARSSKSKSAIFESYLILSMASKDTWGGEIPPDLPKDIQYSECHRVGETEYLIFLSESAGAYQTNYSIFYLDIKDKDFEFIRLSIPQYSISTHKVEYEDTVLGNIEMLSPKAFSISQRSGSAEGIGQTYSFKDRKLVLEKQEIWWNPMQVSPESYSQFLGRSKIDVDGRRSAIMWPA